MAELPVGTRLKTDGGREIEVIKELGRGGQGIIYQIRMDGEFRALRWYHESIAWPGYADLRKKVEMGSPGKYFLWPQDTLISEEYHSYGCITEFMPADYVSMFKFLVRGRFHLARARVDAMIHLADSFWHLHKKKFFFQSLSDGDIWICPQDGKIVICGYETISYPGDHRKDLGACRYMAPEVVLGQKMPDAYTDDHLLAVLLFELACGGHPLEGSGAMPPCMTSSIERHIYGSHPVFIFDPEDTSNRPVPGIHTNVIERWESLPEFVQREFINTFSDSAMTYNPAGKRCWSPRNLPGEWLAILGHYKMISGFCSGDPQDVTDIPAENKKPKKLKPVIPLVLLLDSSGSMVRNKKICQMNAAVGKVISQLRDISWEYPEVEIRIGILEVSSQCRWCTHDSFDVGGIVLLDGLLWEELTASGLTVIGEAFRELNRMLSPSKLSRYGEVAGAPIILLLAEGMPSDPWENALKELQQNRYFRRAARVAVSVDDGADEMLADFTGDPENVVKLDSNFEDLESTLCGLAVNASAIQIENAENDLPSEEEARQRVQQAILKTAADQTETKHTEVILEDIWNSKAW